MAAPHNTSSQALRRVDRLERACIAGDLVRVQSLILHEAPFVYSSFALAAAMHAGHVEVSRYLLDAGVRLLAAPDASAAPTELLPPPDTFTRFALTEKSVGLLRHPQEPTVSDVIFSPFKPTDPLVGGPFEEAFASSPEAPATASGCMAFDLQKACRCVEVLASENRFDATTFDDLARAALVRAWKALRHEGSYDLYTFDLCTALVSKLLTLHAAGAGDSRLDRMLSYMVVPRAAYPMLEFVATKASTAFAQAAASNVTSKTNADALPWLLQDHALLGQLVRKMPSGGAPKDNHQILCALAQTGELDAARTALTWTFAAPHASLTSAMELAAAAGHAQLAAELYQASFALPSTSADKSEDLFL